MVPQRHLTIILIWYLSGAMLAPCFAAHFAGNMAEWYTLKSQGKTIGNIAIQQGLHPESPDLTVTQIENLTPSSRAGQAFPIHSQTQFLEDTKTHQPRGFHYAYQLGDSKLIEAEGHIQKGILNITWQQEQQQTLSQATVDESFVFPAGNATETLYQRHYTDPTGQPFHYQTVHLGIRPQLIQTQVIPLEKTKVKTTANTQRVVRKFELSNPLAPAHKLYEWRDAQGKLYKSASMGQNPLELVYALQQTAMLSPIEPAAHSDLIQNTTVISNIIPQPRTTTQAKYHILPIATAPFSLKEVLPESFTQQILSTSISGGLYLKVQQKEPDNALATFPIARFAQPEYLSSSPFFQVTDPELVNTALNIAQGETRAYFTARKLQQWVHQHIENKNYGVGFASAKATLENREGDCTEHAVLLTALLRTLGIPARVAVGFIYMPQPESSLGQFVFHMWTEAYIGTRTSGDWIALDATTESPLADATHIKLADSPLNTTDALTQLTNQVMQVSGRLRIDVLEAISPAQSALSLETQESSQPIGLSTININQFDIRKLSQQSIHHYRVALSNLDDDSKESEAGFSKGVLFLSQNQQEKANQEFQKALSLAKTPIEQYLLGEKLLAVGQFPLAHQAFLQAQSAESDLKPIVAGWALTSLPLQPLSEAETSALESANRLFLNPATQTQACTPLQRIPRSNNPSFFLIGKAMGNFCHGESARQGYEIALALNTQDFQSAEGLADWYFDQQKFVEAQKMYQKALNIINDRPFSFDKPWASLLQSKLQISQGLAEIQHNRRSTSGWLQLAEGLMSQERLTEAQSALSQARTLQPSNNQAKLLRFQLALSTVDWDYLKTHQQTVDQLAAAQPLAGKLAGQWAFKNREYNSAIQYFTQALKQQPKLSAVRLALVKTLQTTGAPNNIAQAERVLRQGIPLTDKTPSDRLQLNLAYANLLLENNRSADTIALLTPLSKEFPLSGQLFLTLGKAQLDEKQVGASQASLNRARVLLHNHPSTLEALGRLAELQGKEALALDYYQKAYKTNDTALFASRRIRILMQTLHIHGQTPPERLELKADEAAYLVQLLEQEKRSDKVLARFAQTQQSAAKIPTLQTIRHIQQLTQALTDMKTLLAQQKALQQEALANHPPRRFMSMHQQYVAHTHDLLATLSLTIDATRAESLQQKSKENTQAAATTQSAQPNSPWQSIQSQRKQLILDVLAHLPPSQARQLAFEAGIPNLQTQAETQLPGSSKSKPLATNSLNPKAL